MVVLGLYFSVLAISTLKTIFLKSVGAWIRTSVTTFGEILSFLQKNSILKQFLRVCLVFEIV